MFDITKDHKIISANDNSFKWQDGQAYNLSGKWIGPCSVEMIQEVTKSGEVGAMMAHIAEEAKKMKKPETELPKALDSSIGKEVLKAKAKVIGRQ